MGYDFERNSNDYATVTASSYLIDSYGWTMACWFRPESIAGNQVLFGMGRQGDDFPFSQLYLNASSQVVASYRHGSQLTATVTSSTVAVGNWYFAAMVVSSRTSLKAYLGINSAENTTDIGVDWLATSNMNKVGIAALVRSNVASNYDGQIAEVAIWNSALNTSHITSLANNAIASSVDGTNLIGWWRFLSDQGSSMSDEIGGNTLNVVRADWVVEHPSIISGSSAGVTGSAGATGIGVPSPSLTIAL